MKTFALTRAKDNAQAIATAAKATTAQQGAEVRFIGGGTTLIDLMKLNVEQPQTLIDINRLPLDKIEALPGGRQHGPLPNLQSAIPAISHLLPSFVFSVSLW